MKREIIFEGVINSFRTRVVAATDGCWLGQTGLYVEQLSEDAMGAPYWEYIDTNDALWRALFLEVRPPSWMAMEKPA